MSEIVERVAHALRWASVVSRQPGVTQAEMTPLSRLAPGIGEMYRRQARAAIAAMREPTEVMIVAASDVIRVSPVPWYENEVRAALRAANDAALGAPESGETARKGTG